MLESPCPADYHARFGSGPAGIEPYLQWVHMSLNISGRLVAVQPWAAGRAGCCTSRLLRLPGALSWGGSCTHTHAYIASMPAQSSLISAGSHCMAPVRPPPPADASVSDFYADERVKLLYRLNACQLANRRSSLSGVEYKDMTTIFAWDLISEPRRAAARCASRVVLSCLQGSSAEGFTSAIHCACGTPVALRAAMDSTALLVQLLQGAQSLTALALLHRSAGAPPARVPPAVRRSAAGWMRCRPSCAASTRTTWWAEVAELRSPASWLCAACKL